MNYRLTINAYSRSGVNVDTVAADLGRRVSEAIGVHVAPKASRRTRGGRITASQELVTTTEHARNIPRSVSAMIDATPYLDGDQGGELKALDVVVTNADGMVAFCSRDMRP